MTKAIYFDLDGTVYDLYGVDNWLNKLHAEDATPYYEGSALVDLNELNDILNQFIEIGFTIGVISWLAKGATKEYDTVVRKIKKQWIRENMPTVTEVHIIKYGTRKHSARKIANSILVDDSAEVREQWQGMTINAKDSKNLLKNLQNLLDMVR